MKKILILCILLTTASIVKGQFSFGTSFYGGISALMSERESRRPESEYWWKYQGSFVLGGFSKFKINKSFSLQMELLYNQHNYSEGIKIEEGNANYRGDNINRTAHFISVPILFQMKLKKLQLGVGIQNSFIVYQSAKYSYFGTPSNSTNIELKNSNDLLKYNPELIAAIGFPFTEKLNMELRYSYGLKNIMNSKEGHVYLAHTSQFLIGLSYQIWNGKKADE